MHHRRRSLLLNYFRTDLHPRNLCYCMRDYFETNLPLIVELLRVDTFVDCTSTPLIIMELLVL